MIYETNCAHFLPIGEMALDGVRGDLVVPPGAGMRAALGAIDVARCDIAAIACGVQAEALDIALRQARDRRVAGGRLLEMQGVQWQLADLATDLEASRLLVARPPGRWERRRGRSRSPMPSGSPRTRRCARRSRPASCSAPTAGSTTTPRRG